jgi:hypothetical protein
MKDIMRENPQGSPVAVRLEVIQAAPVSLDCFASFAMTWRGWRKTLNVMFLLP